MAKRGSRRRGAAAEIERLRARIDRLDGEILGLVSQRAELARGIGQAKDDGGRPAFAPDREAAIFRRLADENPGPLDPEAVRAVFREIVSGCRALEARLRVAYLGPEGTFAQRAARLQFGDSVDYAPERNIEAVFGAVRRRECDYGVVPVETSAGGAVVDSLDLFVEYDVKIAAEIVLPIHHYLLSKSGLEDVKIVYSKPQALHQCRGWLEANLPHAALCDSDSTAKAARLAASRKGVAAIGAKEAAELYGLDVVGEHLEDDPRNQTRFWVLGHHYGAPTGRDKSSIMVAIGDRVGALLDLLVPFKEHRLNLLRIDSRPSKRRAWDYVFFLDFRGHVSDPEVKKALADVEKQAVFLTVLGSYPEPDAGTPIAPRPKKKTGKKAAGKRALGK